MNQRKITRKESIQKLRQNQERNLDQKKQNQDGFTVTFSTWICLNMNEPQLLSKILKGAVLM